MMSFLISNWPPLVREIVPESPLLKTIVSPANEFAMAERSVPAVNPSLRFNTVFVAALIGCGQAHPDAIKHAIAIPYSASFF
jgi:hypothetical protein